MHVGKASAVSSLHELVPVGEDNPVADKSLRVGPLACLVAPVNVAAGDHPAASGQGCQNLIMQITQNYTLGTGNLTNILTYLSTGSKFTKN